MPILGAFLGGPEPEVAAGFTGVSLCVNTRDRQNLSTASFRVTNAGYSQTFYADSTGRTFAIVPSTDIPYQVDLIHEGEYINDDPQQFIARSGEHVGVYFDLYTFSESGTYLKVITEPNQQVTAYNDLNSLTEMSDSDGIAVFRGLPVDSTWTIESGGESKTIAIKSIYSEIKVGVVPIYGIRIRISESDPETSCEYTDDAIGIAPSKGHDIGGWANTKLVNTIRPVVLKDGTKTYLDLRDLSKTIDGIASNISSTGYDAMTEFPLQYFHISSDGEYIYIKFCSKQKTGFYAYAHTQSRQIQNAFYVGCFLATKDSGKLYSKSGTLPTTNTSISDFITLAKARGEGYDILTWFQRMYICCLFVLLYKTRNGQAHLRGYVDGSAIQSNSGISFDNDHGISGSTSGTERMSFLWIHDLWGNVFQFLGRAKVSSANKLMVIQNGYSSTDESLFETLNTTISSYGGGYLNDVEADLLTGLFPKSTSGSSTTFWCDYGYIYGGGFPGFGGVYNGGDNCGPFRVDFTNFKSDTVVNTGARLSYCLGIE